MAKLPETVMIELQSDLSLVHIDQYFGPWAIEESRFTQLVNSLEQLDLSAHVVANSTKEAAECDAPPEA